MSIESDFTQAAAEKRIQLNLIGQDIQAAKKQNFVLLNLLDDQTSVALANPTTKSWSLDDENLPTTEAMVDGKGTEQTDQTVASTSTMFVIDQYDSSTKIMPKVQAYLVNKNLNWVESFLRDAPYSLLKNMETKLAAALIGIATGSSANYSRLGGANEAGAANTCLNRANIIAGIAHLNATLGIPLEKLQIVVGIEHYANLPNSLYDLYKGEASSAMADAARQNGYVGQALGIPVWKSDRFNQKAVMFSPKAVAFAVKAEDIEYDKETLKKRSVISLDLVYGIVARGTKEAVVYGREVFASLTTTV